MPLLGSEFTRGTEQILWSLSSESLQTSRIAGGWGEARQQLNTAKEIVEKASEKVSWVDVGVDKVRPEA